MRKEPEPLTQATLLAQYDSIRQDGQPDGMARARAWMLSLSDEAFDLVVAGLEARAAARIAGAVVESAVAG